MRESRLERLPRGAGLTAPISVACRRYNSLRLHRRAEVFSGCRKPSTKYSNDYLVLLFLRSNVQRRPHSCARGDTHNKMQLFFKVLVWIFLNCTVALSVFFAKQHILDVLSL